MSARYFFRHLAFWITAIVFYTIYFGFRDDAYGESALFIGLLLPLSLATTYLVIYWLIPNFLLPGHYIRLTLYSVYLFLASLYAELSLVILLYLLSGDFQTFRIRATIIDLMDMVIGMYFVVFVAVTLHLSRNWHTVHEKAAVLANDHRQIATAFEQLKGSSEQTLKVRSDRADHQVSVGTINYVESLGDYLAIHTQDGQLITKRTLSSLEKELNEAGFLRVHRSFLIRIGAVQSKSTSSIQLENKSIPIGRSYRKAVNNWFS